jgi:hypothetical protein
LNRFWISHAPAQVIGFHYVVQGRLLARVGNDPPVELRSGEIVLLPRNDVHILASGLEVKPVSAAEVVLPPPGLGIPQVTHGGGGEETHIVCGYLGSDATQNPIIGRVAGADHVERQRDTRWRLD